MAKPSWDEAPEWANWLAQDPPGPAGRTHFWVWFEEEPEVGEGYWFDPGIEGKWLQTNFEATYPDWQNTLESRPQ